MLTIHPPYARLGSDKRTLEVFSALKVFSVFQSHKKAPHKAKSEPKDFCEEERDEELILAAAAGGGGRCGVIINDAATPGESQTGGTYQLFVLQTRSFPSNNIQ